MRDDAHALAETLAASGPPGEPPGEPAAPLTGARLDHFAVAELLGAGGMGEVYAATDLSLDRGVAIKVLRGEVTSQPEMKERFLREARAQARFNHPNIVQIHYIGRRPEPSGEESLYFAMERVDGGDLDDLLAEGEPMDVEAVRDAMLQVAHGLRAAHRAGVIHRDIKPSNLMLDAEGVIKIADFGLAKPLDEGDSSITQEGAMVGSPYYMAPEQAVASEIDHRADMYALGASFYHLLTGRPPFEGARPMAVIAKHLNDPPEPIRERAPHVPRALAAIVERLLEKKPADRYDDYDALIAALESAAPRERSLAPITTRAVAALGDFLVAGLLIGLLGDWGWVGLALYLAVVTARHAVRGQTPAKFLLGIEVRRDDGGRLGVGRSALRTVVSLWLPLLSGTMIVLSSGVMELFDAIESLRPDSLDSLQSVLMAIAISHGFMSVLYFVGLGMALFSSRNKAVHDLAAGTIVTHRIKRTGATVAGGRSGVRAPGLSSSGRRLSSRPGSADDEP